MSVTRLRAGEAIAGIGAIGLLITLFFDWFGLEGGKYVPLQGKNVTGGVQINNDFAARFGQSGWDALGWLALLLTLAAIVAALAAVAATVARQPVAWAVGASVATTFLGLIAFCALVISALSQPDLGFGLPNFLVSVKPAAYVGLVFAALIPIGGWWIMADERTEAPYSAPPELEPRPAPPASAPEPPPAAS
jgi:hypothetical protein